MATMGNYCKGYLLKELRKFEDWQEKPQNVHKEPGSLNGKEESQIRLLSDDTVVYLQENYCVTNGIFMDENIIFDNVTPQWVEFCQETLTFELPQSESLS